MTAAGDDRRQRSDALDPADVVRALGMTRLKPREVLFLTGAGISMEPPTQAPGGVTLTERALSHAFPPGCLETLQGYYEVLGTDRTHPRLETVLGIVDRVLGTSVLVWLLEDVRTAPPNALHRFFARHLAHGGRHLTANFDDCIERAAGQPPTGGSLLHFHGSLGEDSTGSALGATLAALEHGLPAGRATRFEELLTGADVRAIVVVGYSGSDHFDVDPALRQIASSGALRGKQVLWCDHGGEIDLLSAGDPRAPRQLAYLEAGGAHCRAATGPTRRWLEPLATALGLQLEPPDAERRRVTFEPPRIDPDERRVAQLQLCAALGLHREVSAMLDRQLIDATADGDAIAAATRWAEGRYDAASTHWQLHHRRVGAEEPVSAERHIACLWVQGRLLRAYLAGRRALRRASRHPTQAAAVTDLAETVGRVLIHMERTPDLRWFSTPRRRALVARSLPDATDLGMHMRIRVGDVRAALTGARSEEGRLAASIEDFDQAEALGARLNYEQALLRDRVANGEQPSRSEFREHTRRMKALGALGDAARSVFLPGSDGAFSIAEARLALAQLEVSRWQRARFAGQFLLTNGAAVRRLLPIRAGSGRRRRRGRRACRPAAGRAGRA